MRRTAALGAALVLAGCGLLPGPPPEWVTNRKPLASCGIESPETVPNPPLRECMLDAWREGRGAELITTQTTLEGDPLTRYTRVHENGTVELFIDWTRAQVGPGEWERLGCQGLRPVRAEDQLEDAWVYVEDGCGALPVP